ncbi:flagellar protein FlaG [Paenibacillus enshidis]|uniref:Flagellar protein FlaG n=1 Tax=Paenibacillus enshidis TaxID=1458439 RepID=A0ABV5ATJ4_9BACL
MDTKLIPKVSSPGSTSSFTNPLASSTGTVVSEPMQSGGTRTSSYVPQDQEKVIADLQKAIRAIQGPQKQFEISMHEQTHTVMIKVIDKETGDLIREVPPEKILDLAARMMEITGLIIDEKV